MGRRGGRVFLKQDSRDDEEEKRHKTREDKGLLKDKSLHQLHNQKWNLDAEAIWTVGIICASAEAAERFETQIFQNALCVVRCHKQISLQSSQCLVCLYAVVQAILLHGASWVVLGGRGIVWQSFPQKFCVLLPLLRRLCGKIDNLAPCGLEKTRYWFRV